MAAPQRSHKLDSRTRPAGTPLLHQKWLNLLFLHWPIEPELLRPLIPDPLVIETFDGRAWLGVTPFHLEDVRPSFLPAFPGLSSFHEVNVRTYVRYGQSPGVWFFSLDASKLIPVVAARTFFMLPYYRANIRFLQADETFAFNMRRSEPDNAELRVSWRVGQPLRSPEPGSLEHFLVERYRLFATDGARLYEAEIHHSTWPLETVEVDVQQCTLVSALGLPNPEAPPLAHFSRGVEPEIWAPSEIAALVRKNPTLRALP